MLEQDSRQSPGHYGNSNQDIAPIPREKGLVSAAIALEGDLRVIAAQHRWSPWLSGTGTLRPTVERNLADGVLTCVSHCMEMGKQVAPLTPDRPFKLPPLRGSASSERRR